MSKQVTRARMEAATGIAGGQTGADADEGIIHGYAVATAGEAKGHGVDLDATTLEQIVELGNASKLGIKSRFGHPSMSGTALGTFLGRARGFWLDTDGEAPVVRANLHLSKSSRNTPQGDLGGYVLGLAGEDPESFGSSVVVSGQHLQRVDEHGNELDEPPVLRVDKLHASDVVDEPAANEGMFDVTMAGEAVGVADGAILGRPLADTLKKIEGGRILSTVDRSSLFRAETPQVFKTAVLTRALQQCAADGFVGTDEASIVERLDDVSIRVVAATGPNPKLTEPQDLPWVRSLLEEKGES